MTKRDYLDELRAQLYFLSEADREDVIREFGSHMEDTQAVRPDLSEEQLVERLPPPASIAARYQAEVSEADTDRDGRQAGDRMHDRHHHGFSFGDLGSMFRFARRDEQELSGSFDGVERVEVEGVSCDLKAEQGDAFSYRIRGRWASENEPAVSRTGGRLRIDCGPDADRLELVLPPSVVELILKSISGDVHAVLPPGANLAARLVSGDVLCVAAGGSVAVATASGDVRIEGHSTDADIRTASGDVLVDGAAGVVNVASQSGDLSIRGVPGDSELKIQSMSGDVQVRLAEGASPEITAESISGDVSAPGENRSRGPAGSAVRSPGGPGSVYAKSVSGDVSIK